MTNKNSNTPPAPLSLVGRKVKLFPNDTVRKEALILSMDQTGTLFEITRIDSAATRINVGDKIFYSPSFPLCFVLID